MSNDPAAPSTTLPVAVIGLGDIAQKAYLPVFAAEPGLDIHLMTRDQQKLDRLGDEYRIPGDHRHAELDAVLAAGVRAAFVHAATDAHAELAAALLRADVDVYVDKPLAWTAAEARELAELARTRGRSLLVGFNRRRAPGYLEAARHPRDLIVLQKHRTALPEAPRTFVVEDFVHVVDTLRFLAPGPVRHTSVRSRVRDGLLHQVVLELSGDGFTALGLMNRSSGGVEESLEVSGADRTLRVLNLSDVIEYRDGAPVLRRRGDWTPVARQRGLEQTVREFLTAVRGGVRLDAEDAVRTQELCEWIVEQIAEQHGLG